MKGKVISMKKKEYKKLKERVKTSKAILTIIEAKDLPTGFKYDIDEEASGYSTVAEFKKATKKMEKKLKKEKVKRLRRKITFGLWK